MAKLFEGWDVPLSDIVGFLRELADRLENCEEKSGEEINSKTGGRSERAENSPTPLGGARRLPACSTCTYNACTCTGACPRSKSNFLEEGTDPKKRKSIPIVVQPRSVAQQVVIKRGKIQAEKLPKVKVFEPAPEVPEPKIPPSVKMIFDYWLAHDLSIPGSNTKTYKRCILAVQQVLRGTFYSDKYPAASRKYDYDEIRMAISRFATSATNPDYEPATKTHVAKLSISGFFWQPFAKQNKSWFLKSLESRPVLLRANQRTVEPLEDAHESLTNLITRKFYNGNVPGNLSQSIKNSFIISAEKMHNFYHTTYLRNIAMSPEPIGQIVDYMLECLANVFGRGSMKPANCSSDWTFNQCLPEYLSEINAWDSGDLESD